MRHASARAKKSSGVAKQIEASIALSLDIKIHGSPQKRSPPDYFSSAQISSPRSPITSKHKAQATTKMKVSPLPNILIILSSLLLSVASFSAKSPSLQSLLAKHQSDIVSLKEIAFGISKDAAVAPKDDVFYLRYILDEYDDGEERIAALRSNIEWRKSDGNAIVTNARNAIKSAMEGGKWDNGPIQNAAPHGDLVLQYLSPVNAITTTLPSTGDLVYCIRAGKIDDVSLMSAVSVDDMVDFFLYSKEVNAAVADIRSVETDSLLKLITCNDLSGVKLIGGSSSFRKSLSQASKLANMLYPSLNGRTLMLNLPSLLGALVKLFTPLFPAAVNERLRFSKGPLSKVEDLREIAIGGKGREDFISDIERLAYSD